jgi:hypothetical protein
MIHFLVFCSGKEVRDGDVKVLTIAEVARPVPLQDNISFETERGPQREGVFPNTHMP